MEARTAFRISAVSRNVVAIFAAMLVTFLLGAVGGYAFRAPNVPAAAPSSHFAAVHPSYAVGPGTRRPASCVACTVHAAGLRPSAASDRSAADIAAALSNAGCVA